MAEICPTARVEKLLLSTDGSEYSEGAEREAIKLAKKCSSTLWAISVVETNPEFEALAPQIAEKAGKTAREHIEALQARAKRKGSIAPALFIRARTHTSISLMKRQRTRSL